jgi:hypothetical protein
VRCLLGHHISPESRLGSSVHEHLVRNRGQVMDQSEIDPRHGVPLRLRIHAEIRKGELPSLSPEIYRSLNLWRPEQVGLLWRLRRLWHHGSGAVHVVATNLMFRAVPARIWLGRRA